MIPIFDTDLIKEKIVAHLNDAKQRIEIVMAWFTDTDLERALLSAVRRGVQVSVVLHDDQINHQSKIDWDGLCSAGVNLHWYTSEEGTMHHNFCVVDKRFSLFGTYNWTYYAANYNKETFFTVDRDTTASVLRLESEILNFRPTHL